MLKKKYRLQANIKPKFQSSFNTPFFILRAAHNSLSYNRYGFVVSKQVDKRATVRNRVKRVLRSCIEEVLRQIRQGFDIILIIRKSAVGVSRQELMKTLAEQLQKAALL